MGIPFRIRLVAVAAAAAALAACGGGSGSGSNSSREVTNGNAGGNKGGRAVDMIDTVGGNSEFVAKLASCIGPSKPETGLQGQVPAALRATGFKGFNCNLSLVGQLPGEGGNWSSATFKKGTQHCAYYSTATPSQDATLLRKKPGVPVIDIRDATKPLFVTNLTTPAMMDSWESLRVNHPRQILIADNGQDGGGGPEVDIYDISADCTAPQLLASMPVGTGADGGIKPAAAPVGHEGNISPDGLTYYIGDLDNKSYHAVDVTNPRKPKLIATFPISNLGLNSNAGVHGLSVSNDGNRLYGVITSLPTGTPIDSAQAHNGFAIFDTSEVQQRQPGAQIKLISKAVFNDGSLAQHTLAIKVGGKPYLVHVDEAGSTGLSNAGAVASACAAGLSPFPMPRIYDISDEKNPKLVSKLQLETHDTKNCAQVTPDIADLAIFTYGSHYCSVDNRDNATVMACSYFNSGIRVFDIRNPALPREIAYFNPPAGERLPGSSHARFGQWRPGGPDWCASRLDFDFHNKRLTTMCQDNGLMVMQFAPGTWPFPESTHSTNQN